MMHSITQEIVDPELNTLATQMLLNSQTWVLAFLQFADEHHNEMVAAPSTTKKETWELTKALMAEVLRNLRSARNVVRNVRQTDRLMHIWGCLKGHTAMKEFTEHSFRDHASLAGIQTRFILKRKTDLDGLDKITTKTSTIEAKINAVGQRVTTLEKKSKT
jgi:hypothetical protein